MGLGRSYLPLLIRNCRYNPGDVAVVHPFAAVSEVDLFLVTMGWENLADDMFTVEHTMLGMTNQVLMSWHPSLIFGRSDVS
jgi:hypothetical protein